MNLFEHRYYRLSKNFMSLLGQWPYQSARSKRAFSAFIIVMGITGFPPPLLAFMKYRHDLSTVLDCVNSYILSSICFMRFINISWNAQKTVKLLNGICMNWQLWARDREVNILHEYAEQGEKMTRMYTAAIYSCAILYVTEPMIPKIIDVLLKNGTVAGKFPYPVDYYYFDAQKYYCYIMMHLYICVCLIVVPSVASDNILIVYVQHLCGVFTALGYKLQQIGSNDASEEIDVHISLLINRHNDAIKYANLMESIYTWNFFITIGLGAILNLIIGIQILMRTSEPETTIRFIAFGLSLAMVLFVECNICDALMEHSVNIRFYTYGSQWYRLLPRDQKLLQLMILRCGVPCRLTAGKMLTMSRRSYGMIGRTFMSYFTFLRTMAGLNVA